MFTILALKVWQPTGVGMNRGNHEAEPCAIKGYQKTKGEDATMSLVGFVEIIVGRDMLLRKRTGGKMHHIF